MTGMAGWHTTDTTSAGRRFCVRGTDLAVPGIFTAPSDFTIKIPFYYDPAASNDNWERGLLGAGVASPTVWPTSGPTTSEEKLRIYVATGTATPSQNSIRLFFQNATGTRVGLNQNAINHRMTEGKHYLAVWTYDHTNGGDHKLYLYEEGSAGKVSYVERANVPLGAMLGTDQLAIGNYRADGRSDQSAALDSPVFGVVATHGVMTEAQLDALWGDGSAPSFRDLFLSGATEAIADMAFTLGMVSEHEDWASNAMETYKVWDDAVAANSRIQYWEDADGDNASAYIAVKSNIIDGVDYADDGTNTNPELIGASPFDTAQPWGSFWQPGQVINSTGSANIGGNLPRLRSIINQTRTGTKPLIMGSLGNSRCAKTGTGIIGDAGGAAGIYGHQSLAYGFVRARPSYFGGIFSCNINENTAQTTAIFARLSTGSPSGATKKAINRAGFGSTTTGAAPPLVDGPGNVFQLATTETTTIRFDTRDPDGVTGTRPTQPIVAMLKRPGAGSAVVQGNTHTAHDSTAAGTLVGTAYNTGSLDTTTASATLSAAVTSGSTQLSIIGTTGTFTVGDLVHFAEDDDLNEILSVASTGGGNTTYNLKFQVNGAKTLGFSASSGPLGYAIIETGSIESIAADDANAYRGAKITATGTVEVIGVGFYYTDKPSAIMQIIQGWGGNGEPTQVATSFTDAYGTFATAIGMDAVLLTLGTQGVTTAAEMQQAITDRLGVHASTLEVLGAPEGAYQGSNFLAETDFSAATQGAKDFASSHANAAYIPIFDTGYDLPTAAFSGHLYDGSHQSPQGSVFRGGLLWTAVEPGGSAAGALGGSTRDTRGVGTRDPRRAVR